MILIRTARAGCDELRELLKSGKNGIYVVRYGDRCFEAMPEGCSKGSGIRRLADYLGIHPGEILAVGDNINDLDMFEAAGWSAAVGNAAEELKRGQTMSAGAKPFRASLRQSDILFWRENAVKKPILKKAEPYLWLLPAFILFAVFTFYPFLVTAFKSLFIVDSFGHLKRFVGLENYAYIFEDKVFVKSIINTLIFTLLTVPTSKILGLLLALLANKRRKTSAFYEASFAVPMAMASSVTAMIFQLLYVPSLGLINGVFGLDIQWLNDPKFALLAISIVQIWLSTGYAFIFLLSAVRGISPDIIESASLEGASPLQMIFKIYLPLTSPTMFYLIITDISFSVMMMSLSNVLTNGGPQNSTITMMQYIYKQIAGTANYTNANPAAIVAFLIAFAATMAGFAWEKKGVHYQ